MSWLVCPANFQISTVSVSLEPKSKKKTNKTSSLNYLAEFDSMCYCVIEGSVKRSFSISGKHLFWLGTATHIYMYGELSAQE